MGFVYFIQSIGARDLIKIGYSAIHPARRLACLRAMNAEPLLLRGFIEGDMDTERALHAEFADLRVHHEWFEPLLPLRKFIEQHAHPYYDPTIKRPKPWRKAEPQTLRPLPMPVLPGTPAFERRRQNAWRLVRIAYHWGGETEIQRADDWAAMCQVPEDEMREAVEAGYPEDIVATAKIEQLRRDRRRVTREYEDAYSEIIPGRPRCTPITFRAASPSSPI